MNKKTMIWACFLLVLSGCVSRPTIESYIQSKPDAIDTQIEEVIEYVGKIEQGDVSFGLSLLKDIYDDEFYNLSILVIDADEKFYTETHSFEERLCFHLDQEDFVWHDDITTLSEVPFEYRSVEDKGKTYYCGFIKGKQQSVSYKGEEIQFENFTLFNPESFEVCIWVVELDQEDIFDINQLAYN